MDLVVTPGVLAHFPASTLQSRSDFSRALLISPSSLRCAKLGVASVEIASPRASAAAIGLFTRTMHRSPCKVPPRMRVTRRVENRHTARSALLQGCVSRLEGTVTKLSSPRRAREKSFGEVIFCFHLHTDEPAETAARHARDRADWPKVGIFAQRRRMRPNRLGYAYAAWSRVGISYLRTR